MKKLENKEIKLQQLQNQILKDIENNLNYDNTTKYHLRKWVLNPGFYGNIYKGNTELKTNNA